MEQLLHDPDFTPVWCAVDSNAQELVQDHHTPDTLPVVQHTSTLVSANKENAPGEFCV